MSHLPFFLTFAIIYGFAALIPGPAVMAVVARAMAMGLRGMPALIFGLLVGECGWLLYSNLDLHSIPATLYNTFTYVYTLSRFVGASYLFYLALTLWRFPASLACGRSMPIQVQHLLQVFLGFSLTFPNPKIIVLIGLIGAQNISGMDLLQMFTVSAVLLPCILWKYTLFAVRLKDQIKNESLRRWLYRGLSLILVGVAFLVLDDSLWK